MPPQYGRLYSGPPHYQPPHYQPPKKHWTATPWPWVALVAAGVSMWLLYGQPGEIDKAKVASKVNELLSQNSVAGTIENLTCPTMEATKGDQYTCTGAVQGQSVKVIVAVQDDDGTIYIEISGQ